MATTPDLSWWDTDKMAVEMNRLDEEANYTSFRA